MLSILIPLFRFDPFPLVSVLKEQCEAALIDFEIVCVDDASGVDFESALARLDQLSDVRVVRLDNNIGRSSIRNELVALAKYETLLFLDSDGIPVTNDFIINYLKNKDKAMVICGGRTYSQSPPDNLDFWLHWHYGSQREVASASVRNQQSWLGFQTNNFLVQKEVFRFVRFNESIRTYGHEDTLFGQDCKKAGFSILHIDNPTEHIGLEKKEIFLEKMDQAVKNLVTLHKKGIKIQTKLSLNAQKLQVSPLLPLVRIAFILVRPILNLNIRRQRPFLALLDLRKLDTYLNHIK